MLQDPSISLLEPYKSYWLHARDQLRPSVSVQYVQLWEKVTTDPVYVGCAERLSVILEACSNLGHKKLISGVGTIYPIQLGFFNHVHEDDADAINYLARWTDAFIEKRVKSAIHGGKWYISRLKTNRLCHACYDLAVPKGFNTWSITYGGPNDIVSLPPQVDAGNEDFLNGGIVDSDDIITDPLCRVSTFAYPLPVEGIAPFRCIQHLGNPFYIDLLHLDPPYIPPTLLFRLDDPPDHPGRLSARTQGQRTNEANLVAYRYAANVIVSINEGGAGKNSTLEQRIAFERLVLEFSHLLSVTPRFQLPIGHIQMSRGLEYSSTESLCAGANSDQFRSVVLLLKDDEETQLHVLSNAVDKYSTPPGFPDFFTVVTASHVTEELKKYAEELTNFIVPDQTQLEASRHQLEEYHRQIWQCNEVEWQKNRVRAITEYNDFLCERGITIQRQLDINDPLDLAIRMSINSPEWITWQELKLDNNLVDHILYPGYVGLNTMDELNVLRGALSSKMLRKYKERVQRNDDYMKGMEPRLKELGLLPGANTIAQDEIEADEKDPGPVGCFHLKVSENNDWMDFYTPPET